MAAQDYATLLARAQLFLGLTPGDLRGVASRARARTLAVGERLTVNDELWIVVDGLLRVTGTTYDPPLFWLATPGHHFGRVDPKGRKHSLEVVALTRSEVIAIPRAALERLVHDKPQALCSAAHALAELLEEERELRALMGLASADRMLAAIVLLNRRVGARIPMTRSELAELTGLARETSIRSLSPYEKKGIIRTRRGVIEILKPAELEQALSRRLAS